MSAHSASPESRSAARPGDTRSTLRPAAEVMDLPRLGSLYPFRLSFMRVLVRRIMSEKWRIERTLFELDSEGYGTAIYEIGTPNGIYSFVAFAHYVEPERRSDRVIADRWDMTATLCEGRVDDEHLTMLRENVPLQEAGRIDARSIVLSRANKSVRNFEYVVNELASGRQPSYENLAKVGYLYRTTAVYGSGKFGMADWRKVRSRHKDFGRPFAAEMFMCYMIRQFSLEQVDHLAQRRAPGSAVAMQDSIKRYFGIGNATGLGMAPFLVHHPLLIARWVEIRETALARVVEHGTVNPDYVATLTVLVTKAMQHLREIATDNVEQHALNVTTIEQLGVVLSWIESNQDISSWQFFVDHAARHWGIETQELLHSLLMELYPELTDDLEDQMCVDEQYSLVPDELLSKLKDDIETHYGWALAIDFSSVASQGSFWYRSREKLEPRLGQSNVDAGEDKAMRLDVARSVRRCHDLIASHIAEHGDCRVALFALRQPAMRSILRRIQTMSRTTYGDIHANLMDIDVFPIHLLRCKLSFFGVSKFDPRSRMWVRNTMFQGAPIAADIGDPFADDWCFPVMPGRNEGETHDSGSAD